MHVLWFRRDLRLSDNESLTLAAADNAEVLPCFIIDPWFYTWSDVGKARVKFLFESLENLDRNLKQLGSKLYLQPAFIPVPSRREGTGMNAGQDLCSSQ